ncbi:hypothetical protein [Stenomitos frigidus]|uniref:PRC-barrel domain-containing protein n=1 Tax=Stenomitos frigidus ULC18 TaxID=2107698 RepID=A0A2T1E5Z2_9CYAN|nr:hypothetical protein [Stenomitos frigidus]PSB28159.1 hypothetical protein C7B82_15055 [Stenomitos frigidus ULC18]
MNYASPEKLAQLADSNDRLKRLLLNKMQVLKERLDTFSVVDRHGKPAGEVRNLVLYQGQLSLVIVQPDVHRYWRFVPLSSRMVQQISLRDRVVCTKTTQVDMSYLPDYRVTQRASHPKTPVDRMASARQLPTSLPERLPHLESARGTTPLPDRIAITAQRATQPAVKDPSAWDVAERPKAIAAVVDVAVPQLPRPEEPRPEEQTCNAPEYASGRA